ncbi:MAG: mannitol dehydrogenase family protein [Bifidobacteriaceae bacterium]|jgi:mannitol 2-dehydrogenase|nr:mannitol dehydrogenase family protein [Bifidobacteriaceae bacterium]
MGQLTSHSYDRSGLEQAMVHIGVGNFHRSHQATYIDDLLGLGATDWAYWGVGLLPRDQLMRDALAAQDFRYALLRYSDDAAPTAHVVSSILGMDLAQQDPSAVMARLTSPRTRLVSLTVTEGGYNLSDTTGEFDSDAADIKADLDPAAPPKTVFRWLAESLSRRRAAGTAPYTVVSCDNLPGNGQAARRSVTAFADLLEPGLGQWIGANVAFPNSMVDRITPATSDDDRRLMAEEFGWADRWPVPAEPFRQWVLEDSFPSGRPALERAGVQLTSDVTPYEDIKLRLLNGAHQAIGHFGLLLGDRYVSQTAARPEMIDLLLAYFAEAQLTLTEVPGIDLPDYCDTLLKRFSNSHIRDTNSRLAEDASARIPKFVLPVVFDRLATGGAAPVASGIVAAWAHRLELGPEVGGPAYDRLADRLSNLARCDDLALLSEAAIFGDLAAQPGFTQPYLNTLRSLRSVGADRTVRALNHPASLGGA